MRPEVVRRKVARAANRLERIEAIVSRPREEFVTDSNSCDLASFYLLLAIQDIIDLAAHWVADAGWSVPNDASSTFKVLADHGVIDQRLAEDLSRAAGLRNRIAHDYDDIDPGRLHDEFTQGVGMLRRFLDVTAEAAGF